MQEGLKFLDTNVYEQEKRWEIQIFELTSRLDNRHIVQ